MDSLYKDGCAICAGKPKEVYHSPGLTKMVERVLRRIQGGFDVEHKIDPDLFTDSYTALNEAVDRAVKLSVKWGKPDKGFIQELKRNNAVFAAFKAHREQNDLAGLLVDDDGNARSFDSFRMAAAPVIGEYNVNWLQTEYTTAVRVARTAVRFKQYEKDGDLYPNGEWLPSRAAEPRMSHRKYYHTVRRLTDPWWETHYPGCVWGCQCDMRNTDKPVTHVGDNPAAPGAEPTTVPPSEEAGVRSPGLSRNPARSGELFSRDHPYFTSAYPGAEKAVEELLHEYKPDPDYGKRLMVSTKADQTEVRENVRAAKAILDTYPDTNVKIREHVRAYGVKNPEYEIDDLIADRKGVMSEKGISDGFSKAIKQGCKAVIIDFDMHISNREIKYREVAKRLIWRYDDFESKRIVRCYIIKNKKAICLEKHQLDKNILVDLLKKLEP